ncbi:TPA: hypothetical protein ACH3X1_008424 [Trebouxia sp. C0004]
MVLCTGRTAGDTPAQPSFRARSNTEPSRLDHALVDCGLFSAVQSCKVGSHRHESHHFPMELHLLLTAPTLPAAQSLPRTPTPTWVWDNSQRGPVHMPSCQGRARPFLLAAWLQPLLTNTTPQQMAVPISSWQMHRSALPLTPQPRPSVCGASDLRRGVGPPSIMLPLVEP